MPVIKVEGFSGISPRTGTYALPDNGAQIADNVKLYAGELRSWRKPLSEEATLVANAMTIYRHRGPGESFTWLSWNTDVDVIKSPAADLNDYRIYYTGSGSPKKATYAQSSSGLGPYPGQFLEMGVPAPTLAPTLAAAGGTGGVETRAYVYTFISTFGSVKEESAPSPAALVQAQITGSTVTVSNLQVSPVGLYNITHKRIYRAVSGGTTVTYRLVAEIPIAQTSYTDTLNLAQLPGDPLTSFAYTPPPADLKGLVLMPNGIAAAFRGNELWFSEPFLPHAWPVAYVLSTEHRIVALATIDQYLVVMTELYPVLVYGVTPDSFTQQKIALDEPCVSKRSVAADASAVVYSSPNGLVQVGPSARGVWTAGLFRRDEWQRYNPTSVLGTMFDGKYLAFYDTGLEAKCLVLSRDGDFPPMTVLDYSAKSVFLDDRTAEVFAVPAAQNIIEKLDADNTNFTPYQWRSKRFSLPMPVSMAACQVFANYAFEDSDLAAQAAAAQEFNRSLLLAGGPFGAGLNDTAVNAVETNGSFFKTIPSVEARSVALRVYADGRKVFDKTVDSERELRMPSGFKARTWEIELIGQTPVFSAAIATSVNELKATP